MSDDDTAPLADNPQHDPQHDPHIVTVRLVLSGQPHDVQLVRQALLRLSTPGMLITVQPAHPDDTTGEHQAGGTVSLIPDPQIE